MTVRTVRGGLVTAAIVTALLAFAANAGAVANLPTGFQDEVVLKASEPTNFKFAPDGRTFVALKGGKILVFPKGAGPATTPTVFANLAKQTYDNHDHGLLGLALDPKFDEGRPYVYALYTFNHELGVPPNVEMPKWGSSENYEGDACPRVNRCLVSGRLVRLTAVGDRAQEVGGEPAEDVLIEDWCQQSTTHSIGDLAFGPEGALYVSGGDGGLFTVADYGQEANLCGDPNGTKGQNMPLSPGAEGGSLRAQSLLRPNGEVLLSGSLDRVDPDTGEGWPTNPYASSPNANKRRIVAIGFRNPFRFTVSPRLGDVFVGNVGNEEQEEIDRILIDGPLYNSGWPCYEGLEPNPEFQKLNLNACNRLYGSPESTAVPFFHYAHTSPVVPGDRCPTRTGSAISGSAFYEGSTYPGEYDDALFFADSVRGCIYVMLADGDGEPDPLSVRPFLSEGAEYPGVDLEQGPDGSIYYDNLYEGTIDKIAYDPGAPVAKLKTVGNPWGPTGAYEFDAGESTAVEGHQLNYEWDLEGGNGEFKAGADEPRQTFTFTKSENVTVAVRVEDDTTEKSSIARVTVYPGDTPPKVTISRPASTFTWGVGQQVEFAGSAKGGGAPVYPEGLYWKARLLHCPFEASDCHEHPLQVFPGVKEGTLDAPDHDFPSYIRFFLTATDERGLSAETSVKIAARPVALQFASEPAGVGLTVGNKTVTTPGGATVIENAPTTVIAPETIAFEGVTCTFEKWSDGEPRAHAVPTAAPGTFTAIYAGPTGPGSCHKSETAEPEEPGTPQQPVNSPSPGIPSPPVNPGSPIGPPAPGPLARPKLQGHPARQTRSTAARFAFSGAAGTTFACKLDRGRFLPCASPLTYRRLGPGPHTLRVYATTASGERSAATVFDWKVLVTKPPGRG